MLDWYIFMGRKEIKINLSSSQKANRNPNPKVTEGKGEKKNSPDWSLGLTGKVLCCEAALFLSILMRISKPRCQKKNTGGGGTSPSPPLKGKDSFGGKGCATQPQSYVVLHAGAGGQRGAVVHTGQWYRGAGAPSPCTSSSLCHQAMVRGRKREERGGSLPWCVSLSPVGHHSPL
jgi:hypothetical protein